MPGLTWPLGQQLSSHGETDNDSDDSTNQPTHPFDLLDSSSEDHEEDSSHGETDNDSDDELGDGASGCDLLQRLYKELRKFGVGGTRTNERSPWHSAWHTILDLIFRLMGISERMMDLIISCLHWLADVGEPLTHKVLPKNVHQLKYWHAQDFPNMAKFVGVVPEIRESKHWRAKEMFRESDCPRKAQGETQEPVLRFTIGVHGLDRIDSCAHGHARVS